MDHIKVGCVVKDVRDCSHHGGSQTQVRNDQPGRIGYDSDYPVIDRLDEQIGRT